MIKVGIDTRHFCLACGGRLMHKTAVTISVGGDSVTHTIAICASCAKELRDKMVEATDCRMIMDDTESEVDQ